MWTSETNTQQLRMERYSHVWQCILIYFLYFVLWLYLLLCINVLIFFFLFLCCDCICFYASVWLLSTVDWTSETNAHVYYVYMCLLNFEMNFKDRLTWNFGWRVPNVWECILYVYYIIHKCFYSTVEWTPETHAHLYYIYMFVLNFQMNFRYRLTWNFGV